MLFRLFLLNKAVFDTHCLVKRLDTLKKQQQKACALNIEIVGKL